ncbi:DUF1028 domain-containing protein [Tumebacillus permanentifrigoris]|uniref:Putative Ntn-hydrolase superfamily protein n=1 Tax=Tumebacillus permanentifrigoris TaxID=378543 RepID=A0A316DA88_9BACL|nr:DUF1028 domain-containing protein [Tumebacillus permanentifrigoris]PWK14288.1 putative Ntn-hydrolase superfamily protein [Tumebacillus permanentifrigoris]
MIEHDLNTFSIVARDPMTGRFGVAVTTKAFAVGSLCPFAKSGVGAIATQARVNPTLGPKGLRLLEHGLSAEETLEALLADDPGRQYRQLGIVDKYGHAIAYTGEETNAWTGHIIGDSFTVQGNLLTGEEVVQAVAATYSASTASFEQRLIAALVAGQHAGGDKRGKQSAALLIVDEDEFPYVDIRVDDNPEPLKELQRLYNIHKNGLLSIYQDWVEGVRSGKVPEDIAKSDEHKKS